MVNNFIDFFLAVGFLLLYFLSFAVDLMQLLQSKPHTNNTSFIRFLIGKLALEDSPETPELWQSVGSVNYNLILRQEAWNRVVELWNWRICQWRLQIMKDLSVLSSKVSFFFIVSMKKTRWSVCNSVCFLLTIIYLKIIARKFLAPLNLTRTQVFYVYQTAKLL